MEGKGVVEGVVKGCCHVNGRLQSGLTFMYCVQCVYLLILILGVTLGSNLHICKVGPASQGLLDRKCKLQKLSAKQKRDVVVARVRPARLAPAAWPTRRYPIGRLQDRCCAAMCAGRGVVRIRE